MQHEILIQSGCGKGKSFYSIMTAGQLSRTKKTFFVTDELTVANVYKRMQTHNCAYNSKNLYVCDSEEAARVIALYEKPFALIIDFVCHMETIELACGKLNREELIITQPLNRQAAHGDTGVSNSSLFETVKNTQHSRYF